MKVSLWDQYEDTRKAAICENCGANTAVFYFTELDDFFCQPCAEDDVEEIEEEPSYLELIQERNR